VKVAFAGAGQVGASAALEAVNRELCNEIILIDIIEGLPQGKALDIYESTPMKGVDVKVKGSNKWEDIQGSDIVVVTAGFPRKPGMSRLDLLKSNIDVVKPITERVKQKAPESKLLIVTNPLDIMTYVAAKVTGFPRNRVFGMAGVLDTARFRTFVAMELGVSVRDVHAMLMGGHGDSMVPLPRYSSVSGIPLTELMSKEQIDRIVKRTREGGGEIVQLLKTGSAYYAPGAAIVDMLEAMVKDKKRILPACVFLQGEYGINDVCAGVPVLLGRDGVEKVLELKLSEEEKGLFKKSVEELQSAITEMRTANLL
jgi:malate dehydrogenase